MHPDRPGFEEHGPGSVRSKGLDGLSQFFQDIGTRRTSKALTADTGCKGNEKSEKEVRHGAEIYTGEESG